MDINEYERKCKAIIDLSDTIDLLGRYDLAMDLTLGQVESMDTEDIELLNQAILLSEMSAC